MLHVGDFGSIYEMSQNFMFLVMLPYIGLDYSTFFNFHHLLLLFDRLLRRK